MSKNKKKVVDTSKPKDLKPTTSRIKNAPKDTSDSDTLTFGRRNYILMLAGIALIFIGMLLMLGGKQPSPEVWDESIIYNPRITVLAPIVILAGIGVEIYAIFTRK